MDKSGALEYINQMFPTEASLPGVELLFPNWKVITYELELSICAYIEDGSGNGTEGIGVIGSNWELPGREVRDADVDVVDYMECIYNLQWVLVKGLEEWLELKFEKTS
ncbi:hypothetical protein C5167_046703 [Papaver somniferum]|uniref:Uncharacterized protein n=1 Tax=Papaver somniferum TaxID=3469 RepID=A0A4Y7LFB3_PAPSO|nr:hypothetical protein C5167_046703 [Papaver somniferum]